MIKLIGILVVAVGFALRVNTLLVVLAAGLATGLVAGMSFHDVVAQFGTFFVENRYMTLPVVLMLPLIGMLEHHGLQERAEMLIKRTRAATAGRVVLLYSLMRQIAISLGVRIGEHASTVRPLVAPMAEAAAVRQITAGRPEAVVAAPGPNPRETSGPVAVETEARLPVELIHQVRAHAAAAENVGNFFGEDIFVAVGGVLLMNGFFQSVGLDVGMWSIALWGIPTAVLAFILMAWRAWRLDQRIVAYAKTGAGRAGLHSE